MRHIHIYIIAAIVASMTMVACGNEDIEPDTGYVAPTFSATIDVKQSRAIDGIWEPKDKIGISAVYTSSSTSVYNVCHVLTQITEGKFTVEKPEEQIYFKTAKHDTQVTFNAFYPYTYIANISSNKTIDVKTEDQTEQKSFDFLFASAKGSKSSPEVDFQFTHMMSKVTLVFRNGNDFDVSNIKSCSLNNLYLNGKINISSGAVTSQSNISMVGLDLSDFDVKNDEPVPPFILLPQTVSGTGSNPRPVQLEIVSKDGLSFAGTLFFPSNKLVAGENYIFTVKVNRTGLSISNCTITNWTDKEDTTGWGTGTADSADDPEE